MNVYELMKGKKMKVMTDLKVEVELVIERVEEKHHSVDLEPATRENDWWPASRDWKTYVVHFTNGSRKEFDSLNRIELAE